MKFILFLLLFSMSIKADDFSPRVIESISNSSVKVLSRHGSHGSGVIISSGSQYTIVLTNRHVCQGMLNIDLTEPLAIILHKDSIYVSKEIIIDSEADLCVLRFKSDRLSTSGLSSTAASPGDFVITIGFPSQWEYYITTGYIGRGYIRLGSAYYQETSMVAIAGQSGSGIFNKKGDLIGILSIGSGEHDTLSGMVTLSDIVKFLKHINLEVK